MKRWGGIVGLLFALIGIAHGQTLLTTSPTLIGTTTPLVLTISSFNQFPVTLTANTPIKFGTPQISGLLQFRLKLCENNVGGFTPVFSAVNAGINIINNVTSAIQKTTANYCEIQNWTFNSPNNQLVLETVSPPASPSGAGNLPSLGLGASVLFQDPTGAFAEWVACGGDVTCSTATSGVYTVTGLQGRAISVVSPADAAFFMWNNSAHQWAPVVLNGDVTVTNTGASTVNRIMGVTPGPLATQAIPCTVAQGCTGTGSTLTGIVRGGNPLTASEISGDGSTSGSNALTISNLSHVSNNSLTSSGLANTGVAPGSYTNMNATLNAQGQVTAASNGSSSGSSLPTGAPPQVVGYSGTNTGEAETVSGDFALTRAGANSYTASVASTHLSAALPVNQGGSGALTFTAFSLLYGNGASAFGTIALANDQLVLGHTGSAPTALSVADCTADAQHAEQYSVTAHAFQCNSITTTASAGGTTGQINYNNGGAFAGLAGTGLVKSNAPSAPSIAVANTDYQGLISTSTAPANQFATGFTAPNTFTYAQPSFSNISGTAVAGQIPALSALSGSVTGSQLPNPSASTLGGIESFQLITHQWISSISTSGVPSATRPASTDLSDLPVPVSSGGTGCSGPGTFASVISTLVSPPTGTICTVTDAAQTCSSGTQITSGTGTPATPYCEVINVGTSGSPLWYAAGVGVAGAGSGSNYGTKVGLTAQTSITATCSTISSTHFAHDMVWEVLTGNTTYTTPASGAGCIDGSRIEAYFIQGDNQAYQVTLADGAGTNHTGGGFVTVPTSTGTGQGYFLHVELEYHTNNTQWELKSQITNPLAGSGTATLNYGLALFSNSGVTTSSVCVGRDITNPSATIGFDGYTAGQVTVHGPSTGNPGDTVQINCGGGGGGGGGSGTTAGFSNSPTVSTSGGNATTTLTGQCLSAGCSDFQVVANSSNSGTLTITPENPVGGAGMTPYEYIFVYVNDTGTAPSDVLFAAQSGVTYQSDQPGSGANGISATTFLTGTSATAKLARANSCGSPPINGQLQYNFIWDGTNLTLTGCSSTVTSSFISPALVGGAQWATRATINGPGTDPVLASDTVIEDNTTGGNWTETLPACNSTNIGKFYKFKNVGTGNGSITLMPNGADTIDALSSVTVSGSYAEYTIRCSSTSGVWRRELPLPWTHAFGGTDVTTPGTNGQLLTSNGSNFVVASAARPVGFAFPGTITNSQIVSIPCTGTWNFPASIGGPQTFPDATAQATCDGAGPSGSADDFTISVCTGSGSTISCTQKADVSLAATTCVPTFNANAAFACAPGNTLQVAAPGTTHSEVNVGIMLQGHTP